MANDVNEKEIDTLVDPSLNEETDSKENQDTPASNSEKEGLLKEIRSEREKRHELEARLAALESRQTEISTDSNQEDSELEAAVDRLAPLFQKRGFITAQQKEDEDRAETYAYQLKELSSTYDGSDGRPVFDPVEVANHAKNTNNFNLEAAYRDLHFKELVDWEKRQSNSDDVETERPSSTNQSKPGERVKLTEDFLKQRLAQADGQQWYEKNRDKILAAMAKGQL